MASKLGKTGPSHMRLMIYRHQCTWSPTPPVPWRCDKIKDRGRNFHWLELIFCYLSRMEDRNGNEVVENKIICLAYMLLAEISICYIWKRCLVAGGMGIFIMGRKKFHKIHIPSLNSPTSAPKLDLLCSLIMQSLRKGKACGGVKNNPWIVVQFQGH